jgi:hypothetical protein
METLIFVVQVSSALYLMVMVPQIVQKMILGIVHNRAYTSGIADVCVASSLMVLWLYGLPPYLAHA